MTWARCGEESVVIVGQVSGPGLAMARRHFMETVRPYRPELAVSEEESVKQPSGHLAGQWRQPPSFHRERKVQ